MMTASNAKIRRDGPRNGSNDERAPEQHPGECDRRDRERHGDAEDPLDVDAHEPRRVRVVGGRAEGTAELGALEEQRERTEHADRGRAR